MDYFKQINDTYGHATGDQVLKIFAGFLKEQFRATDIIGRVGGDEFMILMKNCTSGLQYPSAFAKALYKSSKYRYPGINDQKLPAVSAVLFAPTDAESFSQLLPPC